MRRSRHQFRSESQLLHLASKLSFASSQICMRSIGRLPSWNLFDKRLLVLRYFSTAEHGPVTREQFQMYSHSNMLLQLLNSVLLQSNHFFCNLMLTSCRTEFCYKVAIVTSYSPTAEPSPATYKVAFSNVTRYFPTVEQYSVTK